MIMPGLKLDLQTDIYGFLKLSKTFIFINYLLKF